MLRNRKVVPYSQGSIVNGPEVHSLFSVREGFPCFMAMGSLTLRLMMWSSSIFPSGKIGRGNSSPDFSSGSGDVCTQATSIVGWCYVMLCYYLFRGSGFAVLFIATIVWNVIKSTPTTSKPKNVCHHCNIRYSWQWAQDDVARQAAKGYGLIGKAMKKIVVASIEASSQERPCIDI